MALQQLQLIPATTIRSEAISQSSVVSSVQLECHVGFTSVTFFD